MSWREAATDHVTEYVAALPTGERFSANEIWASGLSGLPDNRWLHSILIRMKNEGLIIQTDAKVRSTRGHGNLIRVWEVAV